MTKLLSQITGLIASNLQALLSVFVGSEASIVLSVSHQLASSCASVTKEIMSEQSLESMNVRDYCFVPETVD